MEPEVKDFLVRIVQSLSMGMLWLLINMSIGIYYGFAFFDERPGTWNFVYYAGFILSLFLLIAYLKRKWKGWQENNY